MKAIFANELAAQIRLEKGALGFRSFQLGQLLEGEFD